MHEAAAVPLVALAAWQALVELAQVKPGQKVLVHAGAGGLGSTVIQLAKHLGAHVATTARGNDAELVRGLGADEVVDYTKADFAEMLSGYDVVLDSLGGENLEKSLTVLKPGGLAISVTGPPDAGVRRAARPTTAEARDGVAEPQGPGTGQEARRALLVLLHAGQWRATEELAALYDAGTCVRSSTARSRSTRPSMRWHTWNRGARTASRRHHAAPKHVTTGGSHEEGIRCSRALNRLTAPRPIRRMLSIVSRCSVKVSSTTCSVGMAFGERPSVSVLNGRIPPRARRWCRDRAPARSGAGRSGRTSASAAAAPRGTSG